MGEQRLYSIVVPIYGVGKYLTQCLDSLIGQTYRNIEIILVDDGAKDNSPAICEYYGSIDPRVKIIYKQNGGLVSARKAGAEIASGEYIFCVDGDDWVASEYIERFDSVISQYHPDIVCCGYIKTDGVTEKVQTFDMNSGYYDREKMAKHIYPIAIESENGTVFMPQLWAKAFKKEIYVPEQVSVNDAITIGEDGAVVQPILSKAANLYILDEPLYFYRQSNKSMTRNQTPYDWKVPCYIQQHLMKRIAFDTYDYESQIYRRAFRYIYIVVFSQFNQNESYRSIKKQIKDHIVTSDYREIIEKCKYKKFKCKLEVFLLKHHFIYPIYVFHKLRRCQVKYH